MRTLCNQLNLRYIVTSAKTNLNVENLFTEVCEKLLNNISNRLNTVDRQGSCPVQSEKPTGAAEEKQKEKRLSAHVIPFQSPPILAKL